jgi:hypothetical protein
MCQSSRAEGMGPWGRSGGFHIKGGIDQFMLCSILQAVF